MRILGLWDGHNASAAAVDNGRIVAAVAEERLTRSKMQRGFPHRAVPLVLRLAGWRADEVDQVAAAGRYGRLPMRLLDGWYAASGVSPGPMAPAQRASRHLEGITSYVPGIRAVESALSRAVLCRRLVGLGFRRDVPVTLVPHHGAHAAGAASMLPGDGAVLTMDGYGDGLWATLHERSVTGHRRVETRAYPSSIAITYGAVCQALGFREGDEGKVTALAASGDPAPLLPLFLGLFGLHPGASAGSRLPDLPAGRTTWGPGPAFGALGVLRGGLPSRNELRRIAAARPEDAAAALQAACEQYVVAFLRTRLSSPPAALGLAGGLFANVSINRRISDLLAESDVQVFPAMSDQGLSVGAALAVAEVAPTVAGTAATLAGAEMALRFGTPFLGAPISNGRAGPEALRRGLVVEERPNPELRCAEVLARGGTVAVVSGREEFGPRALGNRSLLFPAVSAEIADRVQGMLRRSPLMPFAPACRAERAESLFLPPWPAPGRPDRGLGYMTFAVRARPETQARFPAAVHHDGTARVQLVTPKANPRFDAILEAYEGLTGLPLVINTSFNLHGDPIVHGEQDAVETFLECGADLLLLGDLLVSRGGTE
ncbi:MAG: hypothetical protein FJ109_13435 [Deltaproteobacteria bacterium]|nr:hypothetical protein [Deltaproteobacteria bacterium]